MEKLVSTPDFDGLPHLQILTLNECEKLEEIHLSLGNHTILEYLKVSNCRKLKRFPTFSQMKNIKTLKIRWCHLKDGVIPCDIGELPSLLELDLTGNSFSRLDFSLSQLTRLKSLNLSHCEQLLELPELPTSLVVLTADNCKSLTIVEDFNKDCKELCQVSLVDGWSHRLLQSMLKANAIENGCMILNLEGLEILKKFTAPLFRGRSCRLKLPENWCNDFSGFLMCAVVQKTFFESFTEVIMKQVSGIYFEDSVLWEESDGDGDKYATWVGYVPFGLLRHTTWWNQTYKSLLFKFKRFYFGALIGVGVRLVGKKSTTGGPTKTSTNSSSPYTPKFKITHDSSSKLRAHLVPYKRR